MKLRNTLISLFVILWTLLFHYESTRAFYLEPFFQKELPRMKFLFPPAGWIMFYKIEDEFSYPEIYGVSAEGMQFIDPHLILETRTIGFDNIHRNVLGIVFAEELRGQVCSFLERKFPEFDNFIVTGVLHPSVTKTPNLRIQKIIYHCGESKK